MIVAYQNQGTTSQNSSLIETDFLPHPAKSKLELKLIFLPHPAKSKLELKLIFLPHQTKSKLDLS
jgi:hypothetical protein